MPPFLKPSVVRELLSGELRHLTRINPGNRPWQMAFGASLSLGLPLLIGAALDHMNYGLVASLGGFVFLYLPNAPLHQRMALLMACAFGMTGCYTLGIISHFSPLLMVPVLIFLSILVTMVTRFYALPGPGRMLFIMVAAIGAYAPVSMSKVPLMVGLFSMGTLLACLIAFFYSVIMLRVLSFKPVTSLPPPTGEFAIFDSVVIGAVVGLSLILAELLHFQKAYWVPISCLAVMQGSSMREVWTKQVHRVLGTTFGMLVAWCLLLLPFNKWAISLMVMVLAFGTELLVLRHYAFAVVFITPMAILLAESASLGQVSPGLLIQARFIDTVLGSVVGFLGGICLHNPWFRRTLGKPFHQKAAVQLNAVSESPPPR